jgi:hypothetical protein
MGILKKSIGIMRHLRRLFLYLLLCPSLLSRALADDSDTILTRVVRPGVVYCSSIDPSGPWKINVLKIDLRRGDLFVESAHAADQVLGRETTSGIAARKGDSVASVVAALNADFFNMETGETVNNQVSGGEIVRAVIPVGDPGSEETVVRSQVGFLADNSPVLDRFVFDGKIFWPHSGMNPLASVNVMRSRTPFVLFTGDFGGATKRDSDRTTIVELPLHRAGRRGDTLLAVVSAAPGCGGGSPLSAADLVLATAQHPGLFDSLGVVIGDTVRIYVGFNPPVPSLRCLVGGIPWLVRDGKPFTMTRENLEGAREEFATKRHPRTGIGYSRDGSTAYFLTVDGRQTSSAGMTLVEFSELMIAQGVYQGLNLDGGGSTTMVVDGVIVNSPSDAAGERPVANCLLLMERYRSH